MTGGRGRAWLLGLLGVCACTDGFAPPAFHDLGRPELQDLASGPRPDLLPGSCVTACDCPAGAWCPSGTCVALQIPMMCCTQDNGPCGGISLCQGRNGRYSQCNSPDAGTFTWDGGAGAACASFLCQNEEVCVAVCASSRATCVGAGSGIPGHCQP